MDSRVTPFLRKALTSLIVRGSEMHVTRETAGVLFVTTDINS